MSKSCAIKSLSKKVIVVLRPHENERKARDFIVTHTEILEIFILILLISSHYKLQAIYWLDHYLSDEIRCEKHGWITRL